MDTLPHSWEGYGGFVAAVPAFLDDKSDFNIQRMNR